MTHTLHTLTSKWLSLNIRLIIKMLQHAEKSKYRELLGKESSCMPYQDGVIVV